MMHRKPQAPAPSLDGADAADARTFFDLLAGRYDQIFAPSWKQTAHDVESFPPLEGVVLDLGCGTGRLFPHLLARGLTVVGLDGSLPMLHESARRTSAASVLRIAADFWRPLPLATGSVNAVVALHSTLAHPPHANPWEAYRNLGAELHRVLRPQAPQMLLDLPEPGWAAAHLRALGDDWYEATQGNHRIELFVPAPERILEAMQLRLQLIDGPLGKRAITGRSAPP